MAKRKGLKKNQAGNLSHEEIWDDSALVRSWDDAVAEYNLYHSIHARGEDVEEVLNRAEKDGVDAAAVIEEDHESINLEDDVGGTAAQTEKQNAALREGIPQHEAGPSNAPNAVPVAPSVPGALTAQVQDPAIKNLMMAWYYAGYYTGLYEGQRQTAPNGNPANRQ